MANYGKRPVNDAWSAQGVRQAVPMFHDGEMRLDRRPYGKIERFVDPAGNVITLQLSTPGDPKAVETALRIRNEKHADGWVEHAKCPLRHGTRHASAATTREFSKMPANLQAECERDPQVMSRRDGELHAEKACPHIEWLIASRRATEEAQAEKRNAARIKEEKQRDEAARLQAAQLEMVKEQLEERKARKKAQKAPIE